MLPHEISKVVADTPDDFLVDGDIDDAELLDELAELVKQESPVKPPKPKTQIPGGSVVDRLQMLKEDYTIALNAASSESNFSKQRRCKRGLDKIEELIRRVNAGKSICEDEIPKPVVVSAKRLNCEEEFASSVGPPKTAIDVSAHAMAQVLTEARVLADSTDHFTDDAEIDDPDLLEELANLVGHEDNVQSSKPSRVQEPRLPDYPPPIPPHRPSSAVNRVDNEQPPGYQPASSISNCQISPTEKPVIPVKPSLMSSLRKKLKSDELLSVLTSRRRAYVENANAARKDDNKLAALDYCNTVKQFDEAIRAVQNGEVTECDESELPPCPTPYVPKKERRAPPVPNTLLEGLQQRLEKYRSMAEKNKKESDDRRYRMNQRIIKKIEEAIKAVSSGKPVDIDELPCPPGFPPLPQTASPSLHSQPLTEPTKPKPPSVPVSGACAVVAPPASSASSSRQSQQQNFLITKQLQFKKAALAAKNRGDIARAKEYLIAAKGFDPMIKASRAGLPVNIKKTPNPPKDDLLPSLSPKGLARNMDIQEEGTHEDLMIALEKDLVKQIRVCEENRLAFTKVGDVSRVQLFEQWALNSKKDLLTIRDCAKRKASIPRFRYETRQFPSVDVCVDVPDDVLELNIIRVINAKLPTGSKINSWFPKCIKPNQGRRNQVNSKISRRPHYVVSFHFPSTLFSSVIPRFILKLGDSEVILKQLFCHSGI
ncbi:hypothetical protein AB6A40_003437 [Gnathostoma spinigerum]|uniref:DM14 domain-containing protein n=1 Tax=Gnathostoma spinigerum TaxID=75299 RepID=A0ABD6E9Q4_9BILA